MKPITFLKAASCALLLVSPCAFADFSNAIYVKASAEYKQEKWGAAAADFAAYQRSDSLFLLAHPKEADQISKAIEYCRRRQADSDDDELRWQRMDAAGDAPPSVTSRESIRSEFDASPTKRIFSATGAAKPMVTEDESKPSQGKGQTPHSSRRLKELDGKQVIDRVVVEPPASLGPKR